ncbi:MAG: alpha/beta fold hydrolase [bacterium]
MAINTEKLTITINDGDRVSALLYPAAKKLRVAVSLILGHGAGANQLHPFMRLFAAGLAERGFDVVTFNFQYMEQGRRVPDPKAKLEACYLSVIAAARNHKKLKSNRIVIGGKSMGGRIASQVAADWTGFTGLTRPDKNTRLSKSTDSKITASDAEKPGPIKLGGNEPIELAGLVFLGYPLHPPGRPDKLRDAHLPQIKSPMLFVQGSRDAFGSPDELRATIKKHHLPATLHVVEGGDHSLRVPKTLGIPQDEVYASTMDAISTWRVKHIS